MKDKQKYPNELFVRFMARNYYGVPDRSRVRVLDIGSGNGANSWYLAYEGFSVTALDKNDAAMAALKHRFEQEKFFRDRIEYVVGDIATHPLRENHFDVIADINTLCHVQNPPMYSLRDALKKDGKFFCIAPADKTWKERVMEGKDYCRFNDKFEMLTLLKPFRQINIQPASYPDDSHQMKSWICEAA